MSSDRQLCTPPVVLVTTTGTLPHMVCFPAVLCVSHYTVHSVVHVYSGNKLQGWYVCMHPLFRMLAAYFLFHTFVQVYGSLAEVVQASAAMCANQNHSGILLCLRSVLSVRCAASSIRCTCLWSYTLWLPLSIPGYVAKYWTKILNNIRIRMCT